MEKFTGNFKKIPLTSKVWGEPGDSNEKIICEECDSKFYVWIKKYNE